MIAAPDLSQGILTVTVDAPSTAYQYFHLGTM